MAHPSADAPSPINPQDPRKMLFPPPMTHAPIPQWAPQQPEADAAAMPADDPHPLADPLSGPLPDAEAEPLSAPLADAGADPLSGPLSDPLSGPLPDAGAAPLPGPLSVPLPDAGAAPLPGPLSVPLPDAGAAPLSDPLSGPLSDPLSGPLPDAGAEYQPLDAAPAPMAGSRFTPSLPQRRSARLHVPGGPFATGPQAPSQPVIANITPTAADSQSQTPEPGDTRDLGQPAAAGESTPESPAADPAEPLAAATPADPADPAAPAEPLDTPDTPDTTPDPDPTRSPDPAETASSALEAAAAAEGHRKHRSRRAARNHGGPEAASALGLDLSRLEPAIPLGPLDGRYRPTVAPLVNYLSEAALNRERIRVEVEWLIHLTDAQVVPGAPTLSEDDKRYLRGIVEQFGAEQIAELAEIEKVTVHDVKSVEYFIKRRLAEAPETLGEDSALPQAAELVHFACTSEDINNLSYALMIRGAVTAVWLPAARTLQELLAQFAREQADQPMLARTHGQPATPTTLGKELAVLAFRLGRQLDRIGGAEYLGKINGATGTFGAHVAAVPDADWPEISRGFVTHLGLTWNPLTTQIESHDWQAELYSDMARFNRVLHNLATDMWTYISLGYFAQVRGQGTVGSSTMPHKVNPIRFENAEANLEISCALLDTLAATLVTSRMQRDLTDSSTQRNIGPAVGHSMLAIDNIRRGLAGLDVVPSAMEADLEGNWEVLGEPIQSAMRAAGVAGVPGMDEPYERLKELTRGRRVDGPIVREFIAGLGLPADVEARLSELTPQTYTGLAAHLVREYLPE